MSKKNKSRVVWNYKNIGEQCFNSAWALSVCKDAAEGVKQRAGIGYEIDEHPHGKNRVNVSVYAATPSAVADNKQHNTLLRALNG